MIKLKVSRDNTKPYLSPEVKHERQIALKYSR